MKFYNKLFFILKFEFFCFKVIWKALVKKLKV